MNKPFYGLVGLLVVLTFSISAQAAKGVVSNRIKGCDYFVVETASDFAVLEWFSGHDPSKGDTLVGKFDSFGFHDIFDETSDSELRIWVEDYGLSRSRALEKLTDKCK